MSGTRERRCPLWRGAAAPREYPDRLRRTVLRSWRDLSHEPDGTDVTTDRFLGGALAWSLGRRESPFRHQTSLAAIYVMNRDGTNPHRLLTGWAGNDLAWSPDGTRIAFSRDGGGVALVNADGTDPTMLIDSGVSLPGPRMGEGSRSPRCGAIRRATYLCVELLDGRPPKPPVSGSRRLTSEGVNWIPRWSPDGAKIAFEGNRADGSGTQIYVIDADGRNQRRLTNLSGTWGACCPTWSPDSTKIAVATAEAIFVVTLEGGDPIRIIDSAWASVSPTAFDRSWGPSWSPFLPR